MAENEKKGMQFDAATRTMKNQSLDFPPDGEKDNDKRTKVRVNVQTLEPQTEAGKHLLYLNAQMYTRVRMKKEFPLVLGKVLDDIVEADREAFKALDGTTIVVDLDALAPAFFEARAATGTREGVQVETEFKVVAEKLRNNLRKRIEAAEKANDTAAVTALKEKLPKVTGPAVKKVYNNPSADSYKTIKKYVDAARKELEKDEGLDTVEL